MFKFFKTFAAVAVVGSLVLGVAPAAIASTEAPTVSQVILDKADLFTANEEGILAQKFASTNASADLVFAVETVSALGSGEDIETVSLDRANTLGLGDAGKDNGVFIFISRDDREVQFQLGSGVSAKISDSAVDSLIATDVIPSFRDNDYFAGVSNGVDAVESRYLSVTTNQVADSELGMSGSNVALIMAGIAVGLLGLILVPYFTFVYLRNRREEKRKQEVAARYAREAQIRQERVERAEAEKRARQEAKRAERQLMIDNETPAERKERTTRERLEHEKKLRDNQRAAKEQEKRDVARRAQQKKDEEERKAQKVAAKKMWDAIPASQKQQIKRASSRSAKVRMLNNYNQTGYDTNALLVMLAASSVLSTSSSSYGSSSSSSSYDSGSSSFGGGSSFSGGSFDGGGGGGSW
jgi:uncharacterized membrane protein YgcG